MQWGHSTWEPGQVPQTSVMGLREDSLRISTCAQTCHYPITWVFGTQREARPRAILWYQMGHSLQTCRCTWWKTVSKFRRNGETSGKQVVTKPGKNTPVLAGCFILWGSFWDGRKLSRENACSARVGEPQSCHAAWNNWSWENCLCSVK